MLDSSMLRKVLQMYDMKILTMRYLLSTWYMMIVIKGVIFCGNLYDLLFVQAQDPHVTKVIFTHGRYGGCPGVKSVLPVAIK